MDRSILIKENLVFLCDTLNDIQSVLLRLKNNVLSSNECEIIENKITRQDKNSELFSTLLKKDLEKHWTQIVDALKETNNGHLVNYIFTKNLQKTHSTGVNGRENRTFENSDSSTNCHFFNFQRKISKDVLRNHFSQEKNIKFYQSRIIEGRQSSLTNLFFEPEKEVQVNTLLKDLVGNSLIYITPSKYNQLERTIEKMFFSNDEKKIINQIIPFVIQKIKMWGCNILTAQKLVDMMPSEDNDDNEDYEISTSSESLQVLSKHDILSCLVASTDPIVLSDIFRIMSKFPIALPLVVKDITTDDRKWSLLVSTLQNCLIKWEKGEKQVSESLLFKSPYKLITAIRLGTGSSIGKSTFLNQLFDTYHVFHCKNQPGGNRGKALSVDGSVEFIWLTKDTCRETIWETVHTEIKDSTQNEIVLLANVHGNALNFPDILKSISPITSKFIAFIMSDYSLNKNELTSLCESENILTLYIDPLQAQKKTLASMDIIDDNKTLKILKGLLRQALKTSNPKFDLEIHSTKCVTAIGQIKTKRSEEFIMEVLKFYSYKGYDKLLRLQNISEGNVESYYEQWKNFPDIQDLMIKFVKIFTLPLQERRSALAHIERELAIFSNSNATEAATDLPKLMERRKNLIADPKNDHDEFQKVQFEISTIYKKMGQSLTIEDFLRELSMVYETMMWFQTKFVTSLYAKLPEKYAEMLLEGMPLEILNGDKESVPDVWLEAVCHSVCSKIPDMKIFVVSILGLQSTGKSTLLNALFGCKFATSVGKCTRGLYMRLIPLKEHYRRLLKVDALLIIDTEGLGSPQTMLEANSQSRDRKMATFALSISDLTLINVSGEVYQHIVDILQIVIIIIAGMDESDISPDILLVQQITEIGRGDKLAEGADKFCDALNDAVSIIKTQGVILGATAEINIRNLKDRIMKKEILFQLSTFKAGASPQAPPTEEYHNDVVSLLNRIMSEYCKSGNNKKYFCSWHKQLKRYWLAVKEQELSKFKSIKQVQDFIEVTTRMASVKSSFSEAILSHQELIKEYILHEIHQNSHIEPTIDFRSRINARLERLPDDCGRYSPNGQPSNEPCPPCIITTTAKAEILDFVSQHPAATLVDIKQSLQSFFDHAKDVSVAKMYNLYLTLKRQLETPLQFDKILNQILAEHTNLATGKSTEEIWSILDQRVEDQHPIVSKKPDVINDILKNFNDVAERNLLENLLKSEIKNPVLAKHNAKKTKATFFATRDLGLTEREHEFLITKIRETALQSVRELQTANKVYLLNEAQKFNKRLNKIFDNFKNEFSFVLQKSFKKESTTYALQIYMLKIMDWEEKWNSKNHPLILLRRMKNEYLQKIRSNIRPDISTKVSNLAELIIGKILDAAKSVSINLTFSEILNDFKKWELGPEKIRIKFFLTLAEKLKDYSKGEEAIKFFSNPSKELMVWYRDLIDNHVKNDLEPLVKKVFESECIEIHTKLQEIKTNDELSRFVNWYLLQIEEVYIHHKFTNNDYTVLQKEILSQLEKRKESYCSKITIESLRLHYERLLDVFGCTATCPGCGAICFGPKDHEKNMIPYKYHFTCHQPKGLTGIINETNGELDALSCDFDEMELECSWTKTKHTVEEYGLMMNWFFLRLNHQLAKKYGKKPASKKTLQSVGLDTLDRRREKFLLVIQNKM